MKVYSTLSLKLLSKMAYGSLLCVVFNGNAFAASSDVIDDYTAVCIGSSDTFEASTDSVDAHDVNPNHAYGDLLSLSLIHI